MLIAVIVLSFLLLTSLIGCAVSASKVTEVNVMLEEQFEVNQELHEEMLDVVQELKEEKDKNARMSILAVTNKPQQSEPSPIPFLVSAQHEAKSSRLRNLNKTEDSVPSTTNIFVSNNHYGNMVGIADCDTVDYDSSEDDSPIVNLYSFHSSYEATDDSSSSNYDSGSSSSNYDSGSSSSDSYDSSSSDSSSSDSGSSDSGSWD